MATVRGGLEDGGGEKLQKGFLTLGFPAVVLTILLLSAALVVQPAQTKRRLAFTTAVLKPTQGAWKQANYIECEH